MNRNLSQERRSHIDYTDEEIIERREAALMRMPTTPHQPHKPIGKMARSPAGSALPPSQNRLACCFLVRGLTRPSIRETLAHATLEQLRRTFSIFNADRRAGMPSRSNSNNTIRELDVSSSSAEIVMMQELAARRPKGNPTHPGAILREDVLPALGLTVTEAAKRLRVTRQQLHRILGRGFRYFARDGPQAR